MFKYKKKSGFTIIESMTYIFFISTIFLVSSTLIFDNYKSYIECEEISQTYNKMQNFYINLDSIINKDIVRKIEFDKKTLTIYRDKDIVTIGKNIKSNKNYLGAKYDGRISPNILLKDIENFEVISKGKLIYIKIKDKSGKEFIRCI